ncbi:MAG: hypothetical protein RSB86_16055 [Comamonas sp.]|uniref:hypothetical protein n=1 Tax=Comamonas sp. TaxID=34028 RepID=UPI002FC9FD65
MRKEQIAQRVNKKYTNLNHPKQSKAHALENIPEFLQEFSCFEILLWGSSGFPPKFAP